MERKREKKHNFIIYLPSCELIILADKKAEAGAGAGAEQYASKIQVITVLVERI